MLSYFTKELFDFLGHFWHFWSESNFEAAEVVQKGWFELDKKPSNQVKLFVKPPDTNYIVSLKKRLFSFSFW